MLCVLISSRREGLHEVNRGKKGDNEQEDRDTQGDYKISANYKSSL